ncbi:MAG: hypothetical protein JEY96_01645 [Bacteroidales bacterium]|nr:hypothetical protein [Bacteroidales bacterium]
MKNTWDELFVNLDDFATIMKEFFPMVPQSPALYTEIKKLRKKWKVIQGNVNKFENEFNPAKPIIIQIPDEFNHKDFLTAWQDWKEYLAEQKGVTMLTRMEAKALQLLLDMSDRNKDEAIYMLNYASANNYPKFFKVNRNSVNNQKPPKDGKFDPDLENN